MVKDLAFAPPCCTRTGLSSTWAPVLPMSATTVAAAAAYDSRPHRITTVAIDRGHLRPTPTALLLLLTASSPGLKRGISSLGLGGRRLKRPRLKSLFERGMPHHGQASGAFPAPLTAVPVQAQVEIKASATTSSAAAALTTTTSTAPPTAASTAASTVVAAAAARAAAAAAAAPVQQAPVELAAQCSPMPVFLLQRTGWLRRGAECAAPATETVLAAGQSGWGRPANSFLEGFVRTEAFLSMAILVAVPLLLRSWAKMEAEYHDTLECRTVVQTYLIAAGGWLCAVLAEVAGNTVLAALLQVAWRVAGARSLWTWSDLGRNLRNTPGWLHASTARWRTAATYLALAGTASRVLALLAGARNGQPIALALSSPTVKLLPRWLLKAASRPDNQFGLSASQLGVGFGLYVWISYYLCAFLPYRLLYDEYQSFPRRVAQFWKDLDNGQEHNVILSTKLGPEFPKHLKRRMAKMPPGDDREFLRLVGTVRQMSCSHTVVQAATMKKNKQGKYGVKMTPLEPGDLRYWGSDIFQRLEQQERRDKQTGWKRPEVAGTGKYKYNRAIYARIMREIKVQLGKSDEEMETDPALSTANLMRFDPDAEEGEFDLIMQKKGAIDAEKDNIRMKGDGHEMVVRTDSTYADRLKEAGMPLGVEDEWSEQFEFDAEGNISHKEKFSYKSDDTAGQALETSIRSQASKKAPATPSTQTRESLRKKDSGAIDASPASSR